MKGTKWFSGQKILKSIMDYFELSKEEATDDRMLDIHDIGIVKNELNEFVITVAGNYANVAPGKAYSDTGERIVIDATVTYNSSNITHTTYDGASNVSTPISSGNYLIPLTNPATNYVWLRYVSTVDDSVYTTHKITGNKQFYKLTDGYEVKVTTSLVTPTATVNLSNFLYLGSIIIPGTTPDYTGRQYFKTKEWKNKIVTPLNDLSDKTVSYILSTSVTAQSLFLDDHIKAVGTASLVGPNNPHGTSIYDTGFTDDFRVSEHNLVQHTSGFVKEPALPTAACCTPTVILGSHINYTNSDALGIKKLAWDSTAGAISTTYGEFIVIEGLSGDITTRGIIIDKTGTLGTTDPGDSSLWRVDFNSSLTSGDYYVYVDKITRKLSAPITTAGYTGYPIGVDYTKLTVCKVNITNTGSTIIINSVTDQRVFGTISNKDVQKSSIYPVQTVNNVILLDGFVTLGDTFSTSSATYVVRTGASLTITIKKTKILFFISSYWGGGSGGYPSAQLVCLSPTTDWDIGTAYFNVSSFTAFLGGTILVDMAVPGTYTFEFWVKSTGGGAVQNICSYSSTPEGLRMVAMEV